MTFADQSILITVRPHLDHWSVHKALSAPFRVQSGAEAERHARRAAVEIARSGRSALVEIYLRNGQLAARLAFGAAGPRELEVA